jgi:putative addiction module component (TIGR02574 family)
MSHLADDIERQALQLAPEEREELAAHLMHSLDDAPLTAMDEAWVAEAERRFDNFKAGKTQGMPGDAVFSGIRRELGWQS